MREDCARGVNEAKAFTFEHKFMGKSVASGSSFTNEKSIKMCINLW